jgi:hypothetical protein
MANRNVHVVPHDKGWAVKSASASKAKSLQQTQKQAIDAGRQTAIGRESELFIHRPNGRIRERNTYGNDPFPPKG